MDPLGIGESIRKHAVNGAPSTEQSISQSTRIDDLLLGDIVRTRDFRDGAFELQLLHHIHPNCR